MTDLFSSGIRPIIDKWLLEKAKEERNYGDYWSASSAGYCMRRNIFERLGVPKVEREDDARKQRVFFSGHVFHEAYQRITKEAGVSIAQELELQDEELMIRGHIDDLVLVSENLSDKSLPAFADFEGALIPPKQHLILYDYKTVNSRAFGYKKDKMSHYWKMQLGTYMYMLRNGGTAIIEPPNLKGAVLGHDGLIHSTNNLTEARILAISKDDLRMAEMQLMWTPDLEKEVVGYWRTLNGYWKKKTMPKCTCADYEGGFLANEKYNGYFYEGEPCSLKYYQEWKEGMDKITPDVMAAAETAFGVKK